MLKAGAALALLATVAGSGVAFARTGAVPSGLKVERVVLLMRHGVRPPTKAVPMAEGTAAEAWPGWSTKPGWLTPRGAVAIERLGVWDGARLRKLGSLPASGCPAEGTVKIVADSDQRTIATADAWLKGLAPACAIPNAHKPQDEPDPIFSAIETGLGKLDPAEANAEVAAAIGPGGIAALDTAHRPLLQRLDAILCGKATTSCGVGGKPSGLTPATATQRPKLTGALDRASTAAQILLLEYADGKPMQEVGWGRATVADIAAFSAFHSLEFGVLARPRAVAAANLAGITPIIRDGLTGPVRLTMISGHDTNIANLGGLLGVHWRVPGLAADDPSPGGAILIEQLRDGKGGRYVRAFYRSQTLEQIRSGTVLAADAPYLGALALPGCRALGVAGLCTWDRFEAILGK
jgi:4-phytase/acid phosphatase